MFRLKEIIFLSMLLSSLTLAEEDISFYEKDFAKNPLGQSIKEPVQKNIHNPNQMQGIGDIEEPMAREKQPTNNSNEVNNNDLYGNKVSSISLIINALNKNHVETVLDNLLTLLRERDLNLKKIYLVSYSDEIDAQKYFFPLMIYNPQYEYLDQIPEKYNFIKNSPTWIIETLQNDKPVEILLEGKLDLSKHITSKGLFIENGIPEKPKPKESPAPPASF
jgi:hypothetical protein